MKLKTLIQYQCWTTLKSICIYFAIMYSIVLIAYILNYVVGDPSHFGFRSVEFSTCIYLGISGGLSFSEDFKMALQNGFTRRYAFIATLGMFVFLSIVMGFIDTMVAWLICYFVPSYDSLFMMIYGHSYSIILQWLWLVLMYFMVAMFIYMIVIIYNRIGKKIFIPISLALGLILVLIVPMLVTYVFPTSFLYDCLQVISHLFGITKQGIMLLNPFLFYLVVGACFSLIAYTLVYKSQI